MFHSLCRMKTIGKKELDFNIGLNDIEFILLGLVAFMFLVDPKALQINKSSLACELSGWATHTVWLLHFVWSGRVDSYSSIYQKIINL